MRNARLLLTIVFAVSLARAGDKGFSPPRAEAAATYPAHESHENEGVTIAIDPYDTPEKTAGVATHLASGKWDKKKGKRIQARRTMLSRPQM